MAVVFHEDPNYGGMTLDVSGCSTPGLALENLGWPCLRVMRGAKPVLWGRLEAAAAGIWIVRRRGVEPARIVPPITAAVARDISSALNWMKWFARALGASSHAPLQDGRWQLSEMAPCQPLSSSAQGDVFHSLDGAGLPCAAYGIRRALQVQVAHFESWMLNGSGAVVPLRQPSDPSVGRVAAWRKRAREGSLPPVLLWWISAFDLHVLIDGHDRLLAAELEGVAPRAVCLWQVEDELLDMDESRRVHFLREYEEAFAPATEIPLRRLVRLNAALERIYRCHWVRSSAARFRADSREAWLNEVSHQLEGHPELLFKVGIRQDESGLSLEQGPAG